MRLSTSLALAAVGLTASALPAAAGTLLVPQQFPTIQKALNAAKPYDTVLVSPKSGGVVYSEAVTISTPHVVLQGQGNPIIDGSKLGVLVPQPPPFTSYLAFPNGVEIKANHVAVRGLTIQGFGFGDNQLSPSAAAINVGSGPYSGATVGYSDIEVSGNTLQKNYVGLLIQGYLAQSGNLSGYRVLGNLISGNSAGGAFLTGNAVLVSGNRFLGNRGDGLDATGDGVTVSGNEAGSNANVGLTVLTDNYDPTVNDPKNPNPAPTVTSSNSVHDNGADGILAEGTETVTGNLVTGNSGTGISFGFADGATVSGNVVTGTRNAHDGYGNGGGINVSSNTNYDSGLKVFLNQVSGNAGDGISFGDVGGGVISFNTVTGNQGVGIHLSDYTYYAGDGAPTTVTQNLALHNTLFDAVDDASAPDLDGYMTANIWTKNLFGTTDPVGLSK